MNKQFKFLIQVIENFLGHQISTDLTWINNINNFVEKQIKSYQLKDITQYIDYLLRHSKAFDIFIHNIIIHKTNWFRESNYLEIFHDILQNNEKDFLKIPLKILSLACSSGEEVYSLGLTLEQLKQDNNNFDYRILGLDIDIISISDAQKAIYPNHQKNQIPNQYHHLLLNGKDKYYGYFTLDKEIRRKCKFLRANIYKDNLSQLGQYDLVLCRNVLIYFKENAAQNLIHNIFSSLNNSGVAIFGTSDHLKISYPNFAKIKPHIYRKQLRSASESVVNIKTEDKVLLIGDSFNSSENLQAIFRNHNIQCLVANSWKNADHILLKEKLGLIVFDFQMGGQRGLEWLSIKRAIGIKIPVLILSDVLEEDAGTVVKMLEKGAQDFLSKKELSKNPEIIIERARELMFRKSYSKSKKRPKPLRSFPRPKVILIGASTGGVNVLAHLIRNMPHQSPPIVVIQHIEPSFAITFAKNLSSISGLKLNLANKTNLKSDYLYCSPGDVHIKIRKIENDYLLTHSTLPPLLGHRPSIDFLFKSASSFSKDILAILLTGMGKDGAKGMEMLYQNGSHTMVQDEESCVVFGMPREALEKNCVHFCGNIDQLRNKLINSFKS